MCQQEIESIICEINWIQIHETNPQEKINMEIIDDEVYNSKLDDSDMSGSSNEDR